MHLAQVTQKDTEGRMQLRLLAQQKAEHAWALLDDAENRLWIEQADYNEGSLVLVELSPLRQIQQIQDATHWILALVEQYLTVGMTPVLLQEEVQRAEQWRQSLTLKSQELGRRALEIEARRDQIQELEENLKIEKEKLEQMAAQVRANLNGKPCPPPEPES